MINNKLRHVSADTDIKVILETLNNYGCVVIDNLLNEKQINDLNSEISPHLDQTEDCEGDFFGYKTKRISSLFQKSKSCQMMAVLPTITKVMDEFLINEYSSQYQINLTQAIAIGPEEEQQVVHRDDPMFPFKHSGHEAMVNCMWALDDFTEENGATLLVPESHRWERNDIIDANGSNRLPQEDEFAQATMKKGSVLIYFGSLYHAGGTNLTKDKIRRGIVISYSLGWLKQAENSFLAYPLEVVKTFPEKLQVLLGYFVHTPNLGCVEGQDPINLIKNDIKVNGRFNEFLPNEAKELIRQYKSQRRNAA